MKGIAQQLSKLVVQETYCNFSAASYMPIVSVLVSLIARITSPDEIPALFAGPPGAAETTTSPAGEPSSFVG